MNTRTQLTKIYEKGAKIAFDAVVKMALNALRSNKKVKSFSMSMGRAAFFGYDDYPLERGTREYTKAMERLEAFIDEWDEFFRMTGDPVKIEKPDMKIVRDY